MQKPLSPHLSIYKPQITSVLSILHRMTGVALFTGALFLVICLVSMALGPAVYEELVSLCITIPGSFILGGWIFALYYHMLNGIRHLLWDAGKGYTLSMVSLTGWAVVGLSIALTLGTCWHFFGGDIL